MFTVSLLPPPIVLRVIGSPWVSASSYFVMLWLWSMTETPLVVMAPVLPGSLLSIPPWEVLFLTILLLNPVGELFFFFTEAQLFDIPA